ncbi:5'/3'-nucleotidase SurE [Thalassoglobus polymorphus]|uniref:5'-nucleotidase SurE n=1 Tax=Thalassoglobus polymorphus TaxID=2527994 RepID=A0A517QPA4_9PLAN|nr:5'/3'-nucleotidase SurE [Thalassoglobus polymorphus]QDT33451.1 5'-nucleotidase SurE [Thalassoglobus polymorphus]
MKILLTNDDGIYAPGLRALRDALQELGEVHVVAPLTEQSGVGMGVTYLHPIMVHEIMDHDKQFGWAVDGSPVDCVKMGVLELCQGEPDLIVSGINAGANVGINVLYSGTVAAAIEGAFFGKTSMAVSLSQGTSPDYQQAAQQVVPIIRKLLDTSQPPGKLWNINLPDSSKQKPQGTKIVPMAVQRQSEKIEKRTDPRGRSYYWSGLEPIRNHQLEAETDVNELLNGYVTVTPLHFDLSEAKLIKELAELDFDSDQAC